MHSSAFGCVARALAVIALRIASGDLEIVTLAHTPGFEVPPPVDE
jgi:hypothetical protein